MDVAREAVRKAGHKLYEPVRGEISRYKGPSNPYLDPLLPHPWVKELRARLTGEDYWRVVLHPTAFAVADGGYTVLIEVDTETVLAVLRGA